MIVNFRAAAAMMAAFFIGLSLASPAAAQTTIFNTTDFRKDRALWTDPAYYRNNTLGELRGMGLNTDARQVGGQLANAKRYGTQGTGKVGAENLASPYPYKTAWEHYQAWLKEANGGTKHTKMTIPDWSGRWRGGGGVASPAGFVSPNPASEIVKLLTPKYQEYLVQELKGAINGRQWRAGSFCLPGGFFFALSAQEFIATPNMVWTLGGATETNTTRWIRTDGTGHSAEPVQFPKWHGESIGFWNGDVLIVHTNQIRAWRGALSEFSEKMETVERYQRVGDRLEGEITLYDPEVLVQPIYSKMRFVLEHETRPEYARLENACTASNGPSSLVFMDQDGVLNERIPPDPLYWDPEDPRPWGTWLNESDKRWAEHLKKQGH